MRGVLRLTSIRVQWIKTEKCAKMTEKGEVDGEVNVNERAAIKV